MWFPFLFDWERQAGHDLGAKVRPCVVLRAVEQDGQWIYLLAPISHSTHHTPLHVELPREDHLRLGLARDKSSYVLVHEVNQTTQQLLIRALAQVAEDKRATLGSVSVNTLVRAKELRRLGRLKGLTRGLNLDELDKTVRCSADLYRSHKRRYQMRMK